MRPLRTKLLINTLLGIAVAFIVFGLLVFYGMTSLATHFTDANRQRSETERQTLERIYSENIRKIEDLYGAALQRKGAKLIQKDGASILPMIEDNAFNQLRSFLVKNFTDDGEMLMASYFVVEGSEARAWQLATRQYPAGLNLPIEYNRKSREWSARDSRRREVKVPDPAVEDYFGLTEPVVALKTIQIPGQDGILQEMQAYDCIIPVYRRGANSREIAGALKRKEPVGYLRYVLSLEQMESTILAEKNALGASLSELERQNEESFERSRSFVRDALNRNYLLLGGGAALVFMLAYGVSWLTSMRVTRPVKELTRVAGEMAAGNYHQDITVRSDDEIGILAETFKTMSSAITRRDEEIRRAERQLSEIFSSVPLGIISVGRDGLIGERYSGYTGWLLNTNQIAGRTAKELVFAPGWESLGKEARENIEQLGELIGKPEMHYEIAKLFLPQKVHFPLPPNHPDQERFFSVTYQPVVQNDAIARILIVLQDETAIHKALRAEKQARLHEDKSVTRIIQLKRAPRDALPVLMKELEGLFGRIAGILEARQEKAIRMVLHSIKGDARILGFEGLTELVHGLEMKVSLTEQEGSPFDWTSVENGLEPVWREWEEISALYHALTSKSGPRGERADAAQSAQALFARYDRLAGEGGATPLEGERILLGARALNYVPLGVLRSLLESHVEETARTLRKEAELVLEMKEITVSEECRSALTEGLMHLINNAIAHGIVLPDERERQGKPCKGRIRVAISESHGMLRCRVADDGCGINLEELKARAVDRKLITEQEAAALSDSDAMRLIFLPGISTSKAANQVSGMGVGMSAVLEALRARGGNIQVRDVESGGTEFVLELPVSGPLPVNRVPTRLPVLEAELQRGILEVRDREGLAIEYESELSTVQSMEVHADAKCLSLAVSTLVGSFCASHGSARVLLLPDGEGAIRCRIEKTGSGPKRLDEHLCPEYSLASAGCAVYVQRHGGLISVQDDGTLEISLSFA